MIPVVVDQAWLSAHPEAVVADVRWYLDGRSGREAYRAGHIPGAVWVDVDTALAAPPSAERGRHPMPEPSVFARELGEVGIADGDVVVAYDDAGGSVAARLVWMLRTLGCEAAVLDGGLPAFGGGLATGDESRPAVTRTVREWPASALATIDEAASGAHVLDARAAERYRGEVEPIDPRAGHIPGAKSAPLTENLAADGRFLAPERLRERFAALGVTDATQAICYCGSGVTACHNIVALEHAGLGVARLYPGSWSAYAATDRPAAVGSHAG